MKWEDYTRGAISWQIIITMIRGQRNYQEKMVGIPTQNMMFFSNGFKIWWRTDAVEMDAIANHIIKKTKDNNYRIRHFENFSSCLAKIKILTDRARIMDFGKLSNEQLASLHKEILESFYPFGGLMFLTIDSTDYKFESILMEKLRELMKHKLGKKYSEAKLAEEYICLTTPDELTFVNKEELAILELAKKKLPEEEQIMEAQKIVDRYYWVPLGWERLNSRTVEDIINKVKESINPEEKMTEILIRIEKAKKEKENLVKKYDFDEDMKHILFLFEKYFKFHDFRKEGQMRVIEFLFRLNDEIGKRKQLEPELLDYSYPEEIQDLLLHDKIITEELQERKKGIYYFADKEKEEFYSGDKALKLIEKELIEEKENIESFSGIAASLGIAIGKTKVCAGVYDARKKMQKGDILITGMTTPDFVPFMKLAAAIITDEGGATCHAAIVSRELGIPCIVGTKIATKVLKDDELIEVDADNNIIRVIKDE